MATLVLGAVGASFGPVGGFIGASLGSVFDNYILFPTLFPRPTIEGYRFDGNALSSGNEGTPMNWPLATYPLSGTVIYLSEKKVVKNTKKVGKGGGGQKTTTYSTYFTVAVAFGETRPQGFRRPLRLRGDKQTLWENGVSSGPFKSISWYDGTQTGADPILEGLLGTGNVPAYLGQVYCVIEELCIDQWARIPTFELLAQQHPDVSVGQGVKWILERAGLDPDTQIQVGDIPRCLRGYNMAGVQSVADALQSWIVAYDLVLTEMADGKLLVEQRTAKASYDVPSGVVGGSDSGITAEDRAKNNASGEVEVKYSKVEIDYQPGTSRAVDQSRKPTTNMPLVAPVNNITLPLAFTQAEGDALAQKLLWAAPLEDRGLSFSLPPDYYWVRPGDTLNIEREGLEGGTRKVSVYCQEVAIGANGEVQITGHRYVPSLYTQVGAAGTGLGGSGLYKPPTLTPIYADLPPLTTDIAGKVGFYVAVRTPDSFLGGILFSSTDGSTYTQRREVGVEAVTGVTLEGPAAGTVLAWDDVSYLDVEVQEGTLESASEEEVNQGANILALQSSSGEWEILGFTTVTQLAAGQYRLTHLLRGLQGTEQHRNHATKGARWLLLSGGAGLYFWESGPGTLNSPVYLKLVPAGASLGSVRANKRTPRGRAATCLAPGLASWTRLWNGGSEDFLITWEPRSASVYDSFAGSGGIPLIGGEQARWQVEIRTGGVNAPVLAVFTTTEPRFLYTEALRDAVATATGWNAGNGFVVHIMQIHAVTGPGYRTELEVIR